MVKIHIQIMIEDPSKEEWNQLMQLAQQGNVMMDGMGGIGEIILDDPVEESDESVSAQALEDAKRAEELLENEKKKKADEEAKKVRDAERKAQAEQRRLEREEKKQKEEAARVAEIEKALETSRSLDEVYATLKDNKVSFKRDEVKAMNKKLETSLPLRTPGFSMEDEELGLVVKFAFGQHLMNVIRNKWFNKTWSLKSAEGKVMIKAFLRAISDGRQVDASYHDKVRQAICDIVDKDKNPDRGPIAEEAYVNDGDVYEFTPDWAHYVLTEEIIPLVTADNEMHNAPAEYNEEMNLLLYELSTYKANHS